MLGNGGTCGAGYRTAALIASVVTLGGCTAAPPPGSFHAHEMPAYDAAPVDGADWSKVEEVKVEMVDYGYRPREIRLRTGQAYRISLINYSSINHYFTAPEFFRSVATRKAVVERYAEVKAPYFTAFEVMSRGGGVDIYVVPRVKGRFTVYCEIDDHRDRGVQGVIIVE